MIDVQAQVVFGIVYDSERHSFLQYLREASPWVAADDEPLAIQLKEMADLEAMLVEKLAEYMRRQRIIVPSGTFAARFTQYNFTNLRKLVSVVVRDHEGRMSKLHDLIRWTDEESKTLVEQMIELKRKHLDTLSFVVGTTRR
jgi:hypothetical protein